MNRTPVADWQQLSALYEVADVLDGDSLRDWLAELRDQAHPLVDQLEEMLAARDQVRDGSFLGTLPRLEPAWPEEAEGAWQRGASVGSYRLERRLGAGGMAEVWLAERDDGAFRRRVAIKLLFRHAAGTEREGLVQRFARERDILAALDHPNIARLHDAGVTPGGQPWIALEYIEGLDLLEWCDERRLDLPARVRLFCQVLLAVQHAHANLVIHRDLKPDNILVTEHGEVRLLDFGIAKLIEPAGGALADTELTRLGGRPMTPQYASPEQLLGRPLTTACDVYSLGVVLYELLCGVRPYELKIASPAQLEQAIVEMEPRPPSRRIVSPPQAARIAAARATDPVGLRRRLDGDLDAVVLHALEKDPARRYRSVDALRAELERWLAGEPVQARPPGSLVRAWKFARRHALGVSLGSAAIVLLAGVATAAVVLGLQARDDSARAVAARDFMLGIFRRANQEKSHGAEITARDMLDTGRRDVVTRLAGQPRLQAELLQGIARIQADMGEYDAADATFEQLERAEAQVGSATEQALAAVERARSALALNRPQRVAHLLEQARARSVAAAGDPEVRAALAEVDGRSALLQAQSEAAVKILAPAHLEALQALGPTHLRTFRIGQALVRAQRDSGQVDAALALMRSLREDAPKVGIGADGLANLDWERVNLLLGAGQWRMASDVVDAAAPACDAALGARAQECRYLAVQQVQVALKLGWVDRALRASPALVPSAEDASLPFLQIEALLAELRLAAAGARAAPSQRLAATPAASARDALESARRRVQDFTESVQVQASLRAGGALGLAEACLRNGDAPGANREIDRALALLGVAAQGPVASRTAASARLLKGIADLLVGHADSASARLQESRDYLERSFGPRHPVVLAVQMDQALVLYALDRRADALATAQEARGHLRDALGADTPAFRQLQAILDELGRPLPVGQAPAASPAPAAARAAWLATAFLTT